MSNVAILTDTSLGLSRKEAESLGYHLIALPFILDENEYDDDTISKEEFYQKIQTAKSVHTSQASTEEIKKILDSLLENYDKVIYFPITSGLSGAYSTALAIVSDTKYKDKVIVVDHKTISVLQMWMLADAKKMIDNGVDLYEIKRRIEENAKNNRIYITVDSLEHFIKGGRVSSVAAIVGNLFSIKPILFSNGGQFEVVKKVRGLKATEDSIIELIKKDIEDMFGGDVSKLLLGCAYTKCIDEAKICAEKLGNVFSKDIDICELPLVVGCHLGKDAIGMAIYKKIDVL